ncbi:MAG: hypothetical protein KAJ19_02955, partial [Gammaproteobacteria bacterium]|nr:hypothetical protein [Gammaproteobacteria bacterium]
VGLVKSCNAECGTACKPQRARPEMHSCGLRFLRRTMTIRFEARLASVHFRSCRDAIDLFRAPQARNNGNITVSREKHTCEPI